MNLSETTFVTAIRDGGYDVRIFTPMEELPFAGHPTPARHGRCATSASSAAPG
jgi:PhzF family phenazine biosynthesis protein